MPARQCTAMPDRHGGLRWGASSQSQAEDAWTRRSADASEAFIVCYKDNRDHRRTHRSFLACWQRCSPFAQPDYETRRRRIRALFARVICEISLRALENAAAEILQICTES